MTVSLVKTLQNIVEIENPNTLFIANGGKGQYVGCDVCKTFIDNPIQTGCSKLFCMKCFTKKQSRCCSKMKCGAEFDKRLKRSMGFLQIKCHFHKMNCSWKGNVATYERHIVSDCDFAKQECPLCRRHVVLKKINTHHTNECIKTSSGYEPCPLNCGAEIQTWTKESHVFNECTNAFLKCPLGENCHDVCLKPYWLRHLLNCVCLYPKEHFDVLEKKVYDRFKIKLKWNKSNDMVTYKGCKDVMFQNKFMMFFIVEHDTNSEHLTIRLENKCNIRHLWYTPLMQTLLKTRVTVTLINVMAKTDDRTHYDHRRPLPFDGKNVSNVSFCEPEFMNRFHMTYNSETNTCFTKEWESSFVVDVEYPRILPNVLDDR